MENMQLIDIADDLVILNRNTVENLYKLDNCVDCIGLYLLYYKLAKWQKTDTIKANDSYVQKCLKWGRKKIITTKQTLKDNGLIEIVQNRSNGKIDGWFIRIHYIISENKFKSISVEQEVLKQEVSNITCDSQETIALRNNINCLKNKIKLLEEENNKLKSLLKESEKLASNFNENLFNKFWNTYPKKKSKGNVEKWFKKHNPSSSLVDIMVEKINQLKETEQWNKNNGQFIHYPTTWLNAKGWEDEISNNETLESDEDEIARLKAEVERRKANGEW